MRAFLRKNMMIMIGIALPLLFVLFFALSTIAIRINKRYISNSNPINTEPKDGHE